MRNRLEEIMDIVQAICPFATLAEDQPFRLTSLAFAQPQNSGDVTEIVTALRQAGEDVTVNNLGILAWLGAYDKLAMSRRILAEHYDLDINSEPDKVLYSGDSTNDVPVFAYFPQMVGVSTVINYLPEIPTPPTWIIQGPDGAGFVEIADAVVASRENHVSI